MSLRLSSILLVGLARVLKRQADMLNYDCHSTWSNILSTPWVTSSGSFNPLISAANTVATCEAITLPAATYASSFSGIDPGRFADATAERHALFGWSCSNADIANCVPYTSAAGSRVDGPSTLAQNTVAWESISLADTIVRRADDRHENDSHLPAVLAYSDHNALSADMQLITPDAYGDAGRHNNGSMYGNGYIDLFPELDDAAGYGGDIHFSDDGNLHFISSSPPPINDGGATVERLHANLETSGSGDSGIEGTHMTPLAGRVSFGMAGNDVAISTTEAQHIVRELPVVVTYDQRLEAVENDLICHWPDRLHDTLELAADGPDVSKLQHARKRQRVSRIQRQLESYVTDDRTYEVDVRALWGSTCVWDMLSEANAAAFGRQTRQQIRNHIKRSSNMYVDACVPSVLNLFSLAPPESGVVDQVASEVGDNADNCNDAYGESIDGHIFDDDLDLELEELRGEAPETTEQELDHLDLHLDIPWLNPDMFNPAQRRQSAAGRSVSIRTESSPDPARYGRQNSASIQGTPNSHVPSLDPLSSEDGLEIRSFELTAPGADADPNLDASMVSLLGLDSFLDISRLGANVVHQTATIEMDRESRSFRQFVLARFDDHRSGTIAFERLLLPSYNNRRVAARAFVDLLQLASKSVFGVHQKEPYATIYISST